MITKRWVGGLALAAAASGCGGEPVIDGEHEPTAEASSAIYQGTNVASDSQARYWNLVALYHHSIDPEYGWNNWWPRPCSGVVVKWKLGIAYVLTARHCITVDGERNGPVLQPSLIRAVHGDASIPTLSTTNPVPPSWAVPASAVWAHPYGTSGGVDAAIIAVPTSSSWVATNARNRGIFLGDPAGLVGRTAVAYGYGISTNVTNCTPPTVVTGSGQARYASLLVTGSSIDPLYPNSGDYDLRNTGPKLMCGDSGGPDFLAAFPETGSYGREHLLGVHSTGVNSPATSMAPGPWVSSILDGLYLTPYSNLSKNLAYQATGGTAYLASAPSGTPIIYNRVAGWLYYDVDDGPNLCMTYDSSEEALYFASCTAPTSDIRTWDVTGDNRIKPRNLAGCLDASSTGWLELRACRSASDVNRHRQMWYFHAMP